ncbi:hypothetical protein ACHHYP_01490 [Achlya hypogyna]|uniref:RING-type domain-containing protein n=1 Tax=Achlya hypogyna TaxID=1202772 RepID=A0A1V9ZTB7_ACHHY|nr:hypothetical protein ACHHYP_01490 [Achlya hypogyna]
MRPTTLLGLEKPLTLVSIRSSAKQNLHKAHLVTYYSLTVVCPTSRVWWSLKRRYSDLLFVRNQLLRTHKNALRLRGSHAVGRVLTLLDPIVNAKFPPKRLGLDTKTIVQERVVGLKEFVAQLAALRSACLEPYEAKSQFEAAQVSEIYRLLGHALAVPTRAGPRPTSQEETGGCAICLEEGHSKALVFELPCAHRFHQDCILEWFDTQHTCPMCRTEAFYGFVV